MEKEMINDIEKERNKINESQNVLSQISEDEQNKKCINEAVKTIKEMVYDRGMKSTFGMVSIYKIEYVDQGDSVRLTIMSQNTKEEFLPVFINTMEENKEKHFLQLDRIEFVSSVDYMHIFTVPKKK